MNDSVYIIHTTFNNKYTDLFMCQILRCLMFTIVQEHKKQYYNLYKYKEMGTTNHEPTINTCSRGLRW